MSVTADPRREESMLHVGLDLSRRRLDVCVLSSEGELVEELAAPPDLEGLRYLVRKVAGHGDPVVQAVIESMTGARFVHDTLEQLGWDVLIADAQRVKRLAPLACKTDRVDARVLAVLSHRNLVPATWLPDPRVRAEREQARFRLHLVKHKSMLKHRIHATLMTFGTPARSPNCSGWRAASCWKDSSSRRRRSHLPPPAAAATR
jgi:transposase